MKNIYRVALALALTSQVIACGKNNNNSNGNTIALAPSNFQSCEPGVAQSGYSGYAGYGQASYGQTGYGQSPYGGGYGNGAYGQIPYNPYRWGNNVNVAQSGFCGCGYGEVAACSPGAGLYCVPTGGISNYAQFNYNGGAYSFGGFNQSIGGSCSTGVGQICQVGVVGSCGQYGQCVQTGAGYGICANQ